MIVEKYEYEDKEVPRVVVLEELVEVETEVPVPIVNVQYLVLNRYRELFVEKEDDFDAADVPSRNKCMTKSDFIAIWNALMRINFTEHGITDACLSDERFIQVLVNSLMSNVKRYRENPM